MIRSLLRREDAIADETFALSAPNHDKDFAHDLDLRLVH
jgi:hypothetical protein